jgi:hypothetical protein
MMVRVLPVILVLAAVSTGCGSSSSKTTVTVTNAAGSTSKTTVAESPQDFVKRILGYQIKAQYGRTWDSLHPVEQAIVSRDTYEGCMQEQNTDVPSNVSVSVVEVYDDPIDVPGIPEKTSKAVTVKLSARSESSNATMHAILHDRKVGVGTDSYRPGGVQGGELSHLTGSLGSQV